MKTVTYPGHIPPDSILGRLMGPDTDGLWSQAVAVEHLQGDNGPVTRVSFGPVDPADTRATRDANGKWWLPLPGAVSG